MKSLTSRPLIAAAAVGALALGLSACSDSGGGNGAAAPSGKAVTQVGLTDTTTGTASGDVDAITWYGGYRPVITLDPIGLADYPEETAIPNMCEPLVKVTPDYQLTPGLATTFAYSSDTPGQTQYVITLRDDVTFWDGNPMTAEDVAYSLNRNLDPKYLSNYAGSFSQVTSIKATGPHEVTVTLKQRSKAFTTALATLAGAVVEKKFAEAKGRGFGSPTDGVMCTGPFEFGSYDGTSKLVLKKNPDYWDSAHAAHAQTFTFVYPADPSALANGLTSGKIDGGLTLPSNLASSLQNAGNGKLYVGEEGSTPINVDLLFTKPVDTKVVQALSGVIDRAGIAKTVYGSTADPLYKVAGPGVWGYARDAFKAAYDGFETKPDATKATASLDGVTVPTLTFGYPASDAESGQIATVVQQEAASIGLTIKLVGIPDQQYGSIFADPAARKPYDLILTKNYVELPEPMLLDQLVGTPAGVMDFSGYSNATVNDSLAQADATDDDAARADLVIKAEAQLAADLPIIPIVQPRTLVFESSRLTGSTLTFSYMTSPWAAAVGAK